MPQIDHVYGMVNGIEGFLHGQMMDMQTLIKDGTLPLVKTTPGAYLGSGRYKLPEDLADPVYPELFTRFEEHEIEAVFYIGNPPERQHSQNDNCKHILDGFHPLPYIEIYDRIKQNKGQRHQRHENFCVKRINLFSE